MRSLKIQYTTLLLSDSVLLYIYIDLNLLSTHGSDCDFRLDVATYLVWVDWPAPRFL